jgi:hypothetical protein
MIPLAENILVDFEYKAGPAAPKKFPHSSLIVMVNKTALEAKSHYPYIF